MIRLPPRSTRTDTLLPYTTLFRSLSADLPANVPVFWSRCVRTFKSGSGSIVHIWIEFRLKIASWPWYSWTPTISCAPLSCVEAFRKPAPARSTSRSEEHTSELQSLMRNSYAVFCLHTKKQKQLTIHEIQRHRLRT